MDPSRTCASRLPLRVEPDLRPLPIAVGAGTDEQFNERNAGKYTLVEQLNEKQIEQLHALVQQQWWGGNRSLEDVRLMAENTSLMIGLVDATSQRLVGYCRVLTDFAFRATIYDVMVAQELQGQGLGKRLMDALCRHPRLQRVSFIYLCCEPGMFPFYERFGFALYEGRTEWMIKIQREE
jgi:predicted N-acetyltransferase YhbS